MLLTLATTIALTATGGSRPCVARCPCVVAPGEDWRSARVMVPKALRNARAVFLGTVVRVDTLERGAVTFPSGREHGHPTVVRYTFAVQRTWKGSSHPRLTVTDRSAGTSCDREYDVGAAYLVYAEADREGQGTDDLMTYSCSRALRRGAAGDDLRLLGRGRAPGARGLSARTAVRQLSR